jgi:hypothetical protein
VSSGASNQTAVYSAAEQTRLAQAKLSDKRSYSYSRKVAAKAKYSYGNKTLAL